MFSEELQALRKSLGLTQQAMADKLDIDRSTYCRLEHKEHPPPYLVERINKEFGVDAWSWLRPPETDLSQDPGPRVVHLRNEDAGEERAEHSWRLKAVELLSRMTDILESMMKGGGKRGGGGGVVSVLLNIRASWKVDLGSQWVLHAPPQNVFKQLNWP